MASDEPTLSTMVLYHRGRRGRKLPRCCRKGLRQQPDSRPTPVTYNARDHRPWSQPCLLPRQASLRSAGENTQQSIEDVSTNS
ncbi:Uu.00g124550.m01.CDS01 [Anthostomella pinea]|uniref:Uu.00g124550.m01.CDS01 n=1 Tax=Anthostomella pinea TaxID=933095 RepID=A0AAI8VI58_9PEZI|nr:Uu.00g124550.m01.CDS01 [Anthostomella pinea]